MKGMSLVSRSAGPAGEVFAASGGGEDGIVRLAPLPYAQQAEALADRNELPAALEMASLIPGSQVRLLVSAWEACTDDGLTGSGCLCCGKRQSTLASVWVGCVTYQHGGSLSQQQGELEEADSCVPSGAGGGAEAAE